MKHVVTLTKAVPTKATVSCFDDHPDLCWSKQAFLEDPIGTILLHFRKDCNNVD